MIPLARRVAPIVVAFPLLAAAQPARPVPVPDDKEVRAAIETLRDVFGRQYAWAEKSAEGKRALARRLLDVARQRKTPGMIFACYDESRRLAAGAGDVKTALAAADALRARFAAVPATLTADTLVLLGRGEPDAEEAAALAALAREAAVVALDREDYPRAAELAEVVAAAGKKAGESDLEAEGRRLREKVGPLGKAAAALKTKPDDPEANGVLGAYWCFDRGNWDAGLKYLAKGSDAPLARLAARDLAGATSAKDRTALGEAWQKLGGTFEGERRRAVAERAWHWYSAAVSVATGDDDLKPGVRARELEEAFPNLFNRILEGHTSAVAAVAVTPDGRTLLSVGNDNSVRVWDAATGVFRTALDGHANWVGSVVISPDGTRAYTAGGDHVVRVWDLATLKPASVLEGHAVAIRGLALSADGKFLVSGGGDKTLRLWDLTAGREVRRYGPETNSVESVAIAADGSRVFAGTDDGVVTVFDTKTGEVVSKFENHGGTLVYTIAVTRDGKTALSGARDKVIRVWDVKTGKEIRALAGHTEQVYQLVLSRDETRVLSASFDKTVRIWDFAGGKELARFEGHAAGVQGVCFGPEERTVFSAAWDRTVRKWRVAPGLVVASEPKGK